MKNQKRSNAMENNIELFDKFIDDELSPEEKLAFEQRLNTDKGFASDFHVYILTLKGVCQEAEADNMEFGHAMKNVSHEDLLRIIGRSGNTNQYVLRPKRSYERMAWISAIAAVLVACVFTVVNVRQSGMDSLDNTIVAYCYVAESNRGWETITSDDIPSLEKAYQSAPAEDIQAQEDAGMRLAMAYLKTHDRPKARQILTDLSTRFADDEEFAALCQKILIQIK